MCLIVSFFDLTLSSLCLSDVQMTVCHEIKKIFQSLCLWILSLNFSFSGTFIIYILMWLYLTALNVSFFIFFSFLFLGLILQNLDSHIFDDSIFPPLPKCHSAPLVIFFLVISFPFHIFYLDLCYDFYIFIDILYLRRHHRFFNFLLIL